MVDFKYTDTEGRKITQTAYDQQKQAWTDISAYKPIEAPAPQPSTVEQAPTNQMDAIKNLPQYQQLIEKWYTEDQISQAVEWYTPPKTAEPVEKVAETQVEPSTETKPEDIKIQAEPTTTTEVKQEEFVPTEEQPLKPLPVSEYLDDSTARQNEIVSNLNQYRQNAPQFMSNIDTFRSVFSYGVRSDAQKQLLDNWYKGYQKWLQLDSKSVNDLSSMYSSWLVSDSDLEQLKLNNPLKYNETMAQINKKNELIKYDQQINWVESTDYNQYIKQYAMNMLSASAAPTNMFEQYKSEMNSPEMKDMQKWLADKEGEIKQIDLQLNSLRKEIEKRYEWTGASTSKINAIYNDEAFELSNLRNTLAIDYQTLGSKYNNAMSQVRDNFELQLQEEEYKRSERNQKMQDLWFAMELMNYETNEERDEREWNKFIRQQEYQDGNIYSNDLATRRKAVEKAVDRVLKEFEWIPMIRSREEMVSDIQNMVENGTELWTAITENIRKPIMDKAEYKAWSNKMFGIWEDSTQSRTIETDENWNKKIVVKWTGELPSDINYWITGSLDFRQYATQYPNEASLKNNNPAWITWNANFDNPKPWTLAYALQQEWIQFSKWTARPAAEWGNYVTFNNIKDWMAAYDILWSQPSYQNRTVWSALSRRGTWDLAWVPKNTLVKDLNTEDLNKLKMAQLKKESPWMFKIMSEQGMFDTQATDVMKNASNFDAYLKSFGEKGNWTLAFGWTKEERQAALKDMWYNSRSEFNKDYDNWLQSKAEEAPDPWFMTALEYVTNNPLFNYTDENWVEIKWLLGKQGRIDAVTVSKIEDNLMKWERWNKWVFFSTLFDPMDYDKIGDFAESLRTIRNSKVIDIVKTGKVKLYPMSDADIWLLAWSVWLQLNSFAEPTKAKATVSALENLYNKYQWTAGQNNTQSERWFTSSVGNQQINNDLNNIFK